MADPTFNQYVQGNVQTFNPFGAGQKVYGGGRYAPNIGPTSSPDGYRTRDMIAKARRQAMLARLKAGQRGKFMNEDYLRPQQQRMQ